MQIISFFYPIALAILCCSGCASAPDNFFFEEEPQAAILRSRWLPNTVEIRQKGGPYLDETEVWRYTDNNRYDEYWFDKNKNLITAIEDQILWCKKSRQPRKVICVESDTGFDFDQPSQSNLELDQVPQIKVLELFGGQRMELPHWSLLLDSPFSFHQVWAFFRSFGLLFRTVFQLSSQFDQASFQPLSREVVSRTALRIPRSSLTSPNHMSPSRRRAWMSCCLFSPSFPPHQSAMQSKRGPHAPRVSRNAPTLSGRPASPHVHELTKRIHNPERIPPLFNLVLSASKFDSRSKYFTKGIRHGL